MKRIVFLLYFLSFNFFAGTVFATCSSCQSGGGSPIVQCFAGEYYPLMKTYCYCSNNYNNIFQCPGVRSGGIDCNSYNNWYCPNAPTGPTPTSGPVGAYCGDGSCNNGEACDTCPADCECQGCQCHSNGGDASNGCFLTTPCYSTCCDCPATGCYYNREPYASADVDSVCNLTTGAYARNWIYGTKYYNNSGVQYCGGGNCLACPTGKHCSGNLCVADCVPSCPNYCGEANGCGGNCLNVPLCLNELEICSDVSYVGTCGQTCWGAKACVDPWWQVDGGGVVAGGVVTNDNVPAGNKMMIGSSGVVSGSSLSSYIEETYEVEKNLMLNNNFTYDGIKSNITTDMRVVYEGNKNISDIGRTGVLFVDGDLTINQGNVLATGEFLMVIVSGNMTIDSTVNRVDGVFASFGNVTISGTVSNQLVINGSIFSKGGTSITREFSDKSMNSSPVVVVKYNPALIFSMPQKVIRTIKGWRIG